MMKLISTLSAYLRYSACLLIFVGLTACGDDKQSTPDTPPVINPVATESNTTPDTVPTTPGTAPTAPGITPDRLAAPGMECSCDADCASVDGQTGICFSGVCMVEAIPYDTCDEDDLSLNCPEGFQCWPLDIGTDYFPHFCWPDCDSYGCDGTCDEDGSCAPLDNAPICENSCAQRCHVCPTGQTLTADGCATVQLPTPATTPPMPPPAGPGPVCDNLPASSCAEGAPCGNLSTFSPRTTSYYDDYPINGETFNNQYRSYLQQDLINIVNYATALVECKTANWTSGNRDPLGLGDMSESDGAIPGTSINRPGHPPGTHLNGYDIDLAYYQINTPDNRLREVCDSNDMHHCVGQPDRLDPWRTALFLGTVFEFDDTIRVIGVDGKIGPLIETAMRKLCETDWLSDLACANITPYPNLAYEVVDNGLGWYLFHHHHAHISAHSRSSRIVTSSVSQRPVVRVRFKKQRH